MRLNKKGVESDLLFKIVEMTVAILGLIVLLLPIFSFVISFQQKNVKLNNAKRIYADVYASMKDLKGSYFSFCLPYYSARGDYIVRTLKRAVILMDLNNKVIEKNKNPLKVSNSENFFINSPCDSDNCYILLNYTKDHFSMTKTSDCKNIFTSSLAQSSSTATSKPKHSDAVASNSIAFSIWPSKVQYSLTSHPTKIFLNSADELSFGVVLKDESLTMRDLRITGTATFRDSSKTKIGDEDFSNQVGVPVFTITKIPSSTSYLNINLKISFFNDEKKYSGTKLFYYEIFH